MAASVTTSSSTLEGQFYELGLELQKKELALPADTRPNNVTVEYDLENLTVTVTGTFTITLNSTSDVASIQAQPYLA